MPRLSAVGIFGLQAGEDVKFIPSPPCPALCGVFFVMLEALPLLQSQVHIQAEPRIPDHPKGSSQSLS